MDQLLAVPLTVVNPGFEEPVIADGTWATIPLTTIPGWSHVTGTDNESGLLDLIGSSEFVEGVFTSGVNENCLYNNGSRSGNIAPVIRQVLTEILQPGLYQLSVDIADRPTLTSDNGNYQIQLFSNNGTSSILLAEMVGGQNGAPSLPASPATGATFITVSLEYNSSFLPAGASYGDNLEIRLGNPAVNSAGTPPQVLYDNIIFEALEYFAVGNPMPSNGQTEVSIDTDLSWSAYSVEDAVYDVFLGITEPNDQQLNYGLTKIADGITETTVPLDSVLENQQTYYWIVDTYDQSIPSIYYPGQAWSFTTDTLIRPIYPEDGDFIQEQTLVLEWSFNSSESVGSYDIYLGSSVDSMEQIASVDGLQTSCAVNSLSPNSSYYWRVVANLGDGSTHTGDDWYFIVPDMVHESLLDSDINKDGKVDIKDIAEISQDWLFESTIVPIFSAIHSTGDQVDIITNSLHRKISIADNNISTEVIKVNGSDVLDSEMSEFSLRISYASPNEEPAGVIEGQTSQNVDWINPVDIDAGSIGDVCESVTCQISSPSPGVERLNIRARSLPETTLEDVSFDVYYEIYENHSAIRKWIRVTNNSPNWVKIDNLILDKTEFSSEFLSSTALTPSGYGAGSSMIAYGKSDKSQGIIVGSEIPSALRVVTSNGTVQYNDQWFEWVIGPGESFESDPLFHYAFDGDLQSTISAVSTPLDRLVESELLHFLRDIIGVAADSHNVPAPQWATWSHFSHNVNDQIVRNMADIAAACGFKQFELDDGWQRGRLGTEPDAEKFPDFDSTCSYVLSTGMRFGLWVSSFRELEDKDLLAIPDGYSLPEVRRVSSTQDGYGMSFASSWRDYYVNDLVYLHDRYGSTYYKQDFSNIQFGDIRQGHESRTEKESYLRALRALLSSQDELIKLLPDVTNEITHEIYWGTPGVPCDIAALKSARLYHIPPNDYSGCGPSYGEGNDPNYIRSRLIQGCYNARQRLYEHRGLPLYAIEYYGAASYNYNGSLTTQVQDRQLCSWLMGSQMIYSGDLSTLTTENINHYKQRFDLLDELQKKYDIYKYFQFSGVPVPTDTDWHWWGKINTDGYGVVVVIRGSGGQDARAINIPWVNDMNVYSVKACLSNKELGKFSGQDLIDGSLNLSLPLLGQEILEIAPEQ